MRFQVVWAVGLCCAACSGDTIDPFAPIDSDLDSAGGTNGGGSGGSAAGTGGGSGDAAGGDGGRGGSGAATGADGGDVPAGEGYLFVYQDASGYRLIGSFERWEGQAAPCTFRSVGPCRVDRCSEVMSRASAGDVTVSSGAVRRAISPEDGTYSGDWLGQLWQPGQAVRFVALGAEAPAIDESVIGPAPFNLLEPVLGSTPLVISRTQATRIRWGGDTIGSAVFALSGTTATSELVQVKCSFDAAQSEGFVPPEALSDLDPTRPVDLLAFAEGYKSLTVRDWLVRVGARTETIAATVVLQ
jgi:hypothetical protein